MALIEGRDYYVEEGRYVFTARYLLSRSHCCGAGCRHCPYRFRDETSPLVGADSAPARSAPEKSAAEKSVSLGRPLANPGR